MTAKEYYHISNFKDGLYPLTRARIERLVLGVACRRKLRCRRGLGESKGNEFEAKIGILQMFFNHLHIYNDCATFKSF